MNLNRMNKYQRLTDLTFELEGLARLASERDGDELLEKRVAAKIGEINTLLFGEVKPTDIPSADIDDAMFYSLPDFEEGNVVDDNEDDEVDEVNFEEKIEEISVIEEPDSVSKLPADSGFGSVAAPAESKSKPLLSVNDRFRFRRELFGNSDPDFNDALNLIATMDSYDEAEDYFINSLEWDSESLVVKEFLEMLMRYYKS